MKIVIPTEVIIAKTKMDIFVKGKLDYYKLDNRLPKFKRYPK